MVKIDWNKFITEFESAINLTDYISENKGNGYRFSRNVSAKNLTTIATGGVVALLCEVASIDALRSLISHCHKKNIRRRFIGNGSNVVISDSGLPNELVIKLTSKEKPIEVSLDPLNLSRLTFSNSRPANTLRGFRISAASSMIGLSRQFSALGLSGFEFAAGIPGTVGGALRMNAGAHGKSFSEIILSVQLLDEVGNLKNFSLENLKFEYRHVNIPKNFTVISVDVVLSEEDVSIVQKRRKDALNYRKETQPLTQPSSGSVFKNPSNDISAGYLLENVGLKGFKFGGIQFSELHANWLVKIDPAAKSSEVKYLVSLAKQKVMEVHDIELKEEMIFWD